MNNLLLKDFTRIDFLLTFKFSILVIILSPCIQIIRSPSELIVRPLVPAFLRLGTFPLYPIGFKKTLRPFFSFHLYITLFGTSENKMEFSFLDHIGPSDHSNPLARISIFASG